MAIGTLYIGTQDYDFSQLNTEWLNKDNYASVLNSQKVIDYHTSIEDLSLKVEECKQLVNNCNTIELLEWKVLSLYEMGREHRAYYVILALSELVSDRGSELADLYIKHGELTRALRTTDNPVLWTAGCSYTSADGVAPTERWGHLVATELGLEEVNTAISGASIWDACDQILRSDIRKDDTVVWGLTSVGRVEIIKDGQLRGISFSSWQQLESEKQYHTLDYFDSPTLKMKCVRQIQQVINFCNKIGAKLYLVNFLEQEGVAIKYLRDKNVPYLDLTDQILFKVIDFGTDNMHPGPLQHKEYAKEIIKLIQGEQL